LRPDGNAFRPALIADYELISESRRYHNRFTLYDPESKVEFSDRIEIHTLELLKIPETADNYLWHWLRFLRAESREDLEMVAQASPNIKKTIVKLLELSEDEEVFYALRAVSSVWVGSAPIHVASAVGPYIGGTGLFNMRRYPASWAR
jgi:hypothetical protein